MWNSSTDFHEVPNIKLRINRVSVGAAGIPADKHDEGLTGAFREYANALKLLRT
jgi:hypothetical protein